jgi:Methyltransferase domain
MFLDEYKIWMDAATPLKGDIYMFGRSLHSRYYTFERVLQYLMTIENPVIVELGTSRSFVTGGLPGCMSTDPNYWAPDRPELWDHGAGIFTYLIPSALMKHGKLFTLHSVDICEKALSIAKVMTSQINAPIQFHKQRSNDFLDMVNGQLDLLYMDTAETDEEGALIHLEDAKKIVEKNLIKKGGLVLIDDVRSPNFIHMAGKSWILGKGKYSIPYLLQNGFEIVMDEYQMLLRKS